MHNKRIFSSLPLYVFGLCLSLFGGQESGQAAEKRSFNAIDDSRGLAHVWNLADRDAIVKKFVADKGSLPPGKANAMDETAAGRLAVKAMTSALGNGRIQLEIKNIYTDFKGNHHVIIQEYLGGVVVDGAVASLHFDRDWNLLDVTGFINDGGDIASTAPALDGKAAGSRAIKCFSGPSELLNEPRLMVRGNMLVYHCMARETQGRDAYNVVIDALTGAVLSLTPTAVHYDPLFPPGYPGGALTNQTGALLPREGGGTVGFTGWQSSTNSLYYLFNDADHWQAINAQVATPELFSSSTPNWGRTIPKAMSLAYNISLTQRFCRDSLGRNSFDGNGKTAVCKFVNDIVNQAQYRPERDEFWFGSGDGVHDQELATLEIVAHEFGHGITHYTSNLHSGATKDEPTAINEALSYIFGTTVEFTYQPDGRNFYVLGGYTNDWAPGNADWLILEDAQLDQYGNVDFLFDQLDLYDVSPVLPYLYKGAYWSDTMEEHINSIPATHCFALIAEGAGMEMEKDDTYHHRYGPFGGLGLGQAWRIAWEGQFNGTITSTTGYRECRNAWIKTAKYLGFDAGVVAMAWAAVGVIDRTVGIPSGTKLPGSIPNYTTIQAAVNASAAGDLIYVYPGTYSESVSITGATDLAIVARNRNLTAITGGITVSGRTDYFTLAGVTVNGVTLSGFSSHPLITPTVSNCALKNAAYGIYADYTLTPLFTKNIITGCTSNSVYASHTSFCSVLENTISGTGILLDAASSAAVIAGNTIRSAPGWAIALASGGDGDTIRYNRIGTGGLAAQAAVLNVQIHHNVWEDPAACAITLPAGSTGRIYSNTFASPVYSLSVPSSVAWNDASLQGNYWNYNSGVDAHPLSSPLVSGGLCISYQGVPLMTTSVDGKSLKVKGQIMQTGYTVAGSLTFYHGPGSWRTTTLSNTGDLSTELLIHYSSPWMDIAANHVGGMEFSNHQGIPVFDLFEQPEGQKNGFIRVRGLASPNAGN
jgi:putative cofactor-binding repeat protein